MEQCGCDVRPCPRNKAVLLTLIISSLQRFYVIGVISVLSPVSQPQISYDGVAVTVVILLNVFSGLLCPVFGYLADTRYGRYKMILFGLLLCGLSLATGAVTVVFATELGNAFYTIIVYTNYGVVCLGSSAIQANMLPFAGDQLLEVCNKKLSSLVYWYFWTQSIGISLTGILFVVTYLFSSLVLVLAIAAVAIAIGLVILICCKSMFVINSAETKDPIHLVKVTCFLCKMMSDNANKDPPLKAKMRNGEPFTTKQVENVKTFYRMLFVLLSMMTSIMLLNTVSHCKL